MASGFFRKTMVFLGLDDEELDDYDAGYEPEVSVAPQPPRRFSAEPAEVAPPPQQLSGIRPLPNPGSGVDPSGGLPPVRRTVVAQQRPKGVHVVAPVRFSDAQEIADRFRGNQPVIVNLQGRQDLDGSDAASDRALARRMIDFCSGVTYALSGSMDRVAHDVFLLTPSNAEVTAEDKRKLEEQGYRPIVTR